MDEENNTTEPTPAAASESSPSNKKAMNPIIAVVVIIAIAVIGYFAYTMMGKKDTNDAAVGPTNQNVQQQVEDTRPATGEAAIDDESTNEAVVFKIEAGSFYFKPNVIQAKLGQTIRVEMSSVSLQHDFVIDELGVRVPITQSGKTATVEFVADTLGEFEFYCSIGNHRQQGMAGKFIVTQ